MSTHGREATGDYSKERRPDLPVGTEDRGPLGAVGTVAAGLGVAGAILAVVATFSTVIKIQVLTVTPASYSGYDRHSVALVVLGVFALVMVAGGVRGARPAMAALALIGLAVLLIAVLIDLPHLNDTGVWPLHDQYEDAQASAGTGYYFETASGILMLVGGAALLLLAPRRSPKPPRRPRVEAPAVETWSPSEPVVAPPGTEIEDEYAPRHRPAARRRQGGIVGRLRGRGR
jgi:hypothetical protein